MKRVIAVMACAAIACAAFAATAAANNQLTVKSTILSDEVDIRGTYNIQQPAGCPRFEPAIGTPGWETYYSAFCRSYVNQDAEIVLRLTHNGRLIYSEKVFGIPGSEAWQGGTYSTTIYRYELRGLCGAFYWKVVLNDPYDRPRMSKSVGDSFRAPCR